MGISERTTTLESLEDGKAVLAVMPSCCPHVTDPDLLDWLEENADWLVEAHCWWDVQREWGAHPWSAEKVVDKF